ncbi:MAG: proprotein convertase P-domain-containing protein [Flavobacteriales bacterium]|nr:proprotein convertase P-domain-containing protein [Flavobacteriales bacterium]
MAVTPGTPYTVTVGAGSTSTAAGGDSWFGTAGTVMAKGGNSAANNSATGAAGGTAAASIGSIKFNGGSARPAAPSPSCGGGGGSRAPGTAQLVRTDCWAVVEPRPCRRWQRRERPHQPGQRRGRHRPWRGGGGAARTSSGSFTGGAGATGRVIVTYYNQGVCISGTNGFNTIPDNACGASQFMRAPIPVTGQPTTLGTNPGNARLTSVELIVAHTFNSDLRVSLTTPGGQTRNLILNRFGNGDNLGNPGACPGTVLTLADGGSALVNTNTSNVAGTYQPEQTLAGFTGDPNGAWVLNICDNAGADVGRLVMARLNFCTVPLITSFGSNSPICAGETLTLTSAATGEPLADQLVRHGNLCTEPQQRERLGDRRGHGQLHGDGEQRLRHGAAGDPGDGEPAAHDELPG